MAIVKDVTIDAPLEKVFAALTNPHQLPQWWGNGVNRWESELRVGGRWASYGKFEDGSNFSVKGVYRIVELPNLVETTCEHWGESAPETIFRYDLMETSGKTHLRVTHSGFPDKQFQDVHSHGWDQTLARLVAFVTKTPRS